MPDFTIEPNQLLVRIPSKSRVFARILLSIPSGNNNTLVQVIGLPTWLRLDEIGLNRNPVGFQKSLSFEFDSTKGLLGNNRDIFTLVFPVLGTIKRESIPVEMLVVAPDFVAPEPGRSADAGSLLRYVYDLILQGWTQGAPSRDLAGERVEDPRDFRAIEWCLAGAMEKSKAHHTENGKYPLLNSKALEIAFGLELDGLSLDLWNDKPERDQFQVLEMIQRVQTNLSRVLGRLNVHKKAQVKPRQNHLPTIVWPLPPSPPTA